MSVNLNQTTYCQQLLLTGGTTGGSFGTTVNINLIATARHLLGIIYSAGDSTYTTAESPGGDILQYVSASLGLSDQRFLVGPYNTSGPATNGSGQSMVQDIIPIVEPSYIKIHGGELVSFALAPADTITTGHKAQVSLMYCQDYPPVDWARQFPLPVAFVGGYVSSAEQLSTTATALTAINIPTWAQQIVACRAIVQKADAISTGEYMQGYFNITSTIPNIAPLQIPTNTGGASLGTPVGTGMYDDWMPYIPIFIQIPNVGAMTLTPNINLTAAVSTGNDVAFGVYWR